MCIASSLYKLNVQIKKKKLFLELTGVFPCDIITVKWLSNMWRKVDFLGHAGEFPLR